jgi:DNA polymerase I-like protein with 3'-5' exonuclease and polymerase domains
MSRNPTVAIIDAKPSRNNYSNFFPFEFDEFHLCSRNIPKILKKDVDIDIDIDLYDYVILVGSEAAKQYAKVSVTNFAGILCDNKFLPITNPAMLIFKPEGKPEFDRNIQKINDYISGKKTNLVVTGDFKGITDEDEATAFLLEVLAQPDFTPVAVDTETTALAPRDGYILGISLSYKIRHGRYISTDCLTDYHIDLLQQIFDKHEVVFHNRKFDQKWLAYHFNFKFKAASHDTMVMHYALDETQGTHGLKVLALKHTDYGDYDAALEEFKEDYCKSHAINKEDFTYDLIPFDVIARYASIDTAVTLELFFKFWPIVSAHPKLSKLYKDILIPATVFLMDMEEAGIPMSKVRLEHSSKYLDYQITEAKKAIYKFDVIHQFEKDQGSMFNPASPMQLRKILFDYLGLPSSKLTETGATSTDAEVLEGLSELHDLPKAILVVRRLTKIKNTYVEKILPALDKDGRVRTNFNLIFTTSGRLSSSGKFNAQQIPRDDPIIKGCITARPGYKIISQDLSTAEVYYAAVISGDKKMQGIFLAGGDFHSSTAKLVFNLPCAVEDVKKLYPMQRQAAKAVTFGILYGSGAASVSETVTKESGVLFSVSDAQDVITDYFKTFSTLKKWLDARKKEIQTNGFIYSFFGRKRRLSNVFSPDKGIAAHEVRSGINALIQSLASDINLIASMDIARELKAKNIDAQIFMLVHDSIVIHCKDEFVDEVLEIMRRCTQKDRGCSIPGFPIGIDQEVGDDYSFGKFDKTYAVNDENYLFKIPKAA